MVAALNNKSHRGSSGRISRGIDAVNKLWRGHEAVRFWQLVLASSVKIIMYYKHIKRGGIVACLCRRARWRGIAKYYSIARSVTGVNIGVGAIYRRKHAEIFGRLVLACNDSAWHRNGIFQQSNASWCGTGGVGRGIKYVRPPRHRMRHASRIASIICWRRHNRQQYIQ